MKVDASKQRGITLIGVSFSQLARADSLQDLTDECERIRLVIDGEYVNAVEVHAGRIRGQLFSDV